MIDTADRIARAAYLWLRQRAFSHGSYCTPNGTLNGERREQLFVAGFIFELCDALQLAKQHGVLAAYAYSLLAGDTKNSLEIAAILADAHSVLPTSLVFAEGRFIAGEMFGLLDNTGVKTTTEEGIDERMVRYAC